MTENLDTIFDQAEAELGQRPDAYMVWSHEHGAWWRARRCGYTKDVQQAGTYTRAEALDICVSAFHNPLEPFPEIMVRADDVGSMMVGAARKALAARFNK